MGKNIFYMLLSFFACITNAYTQGKAVQHVSAESFKKVLDSLPTRQIIDVRTPEEYVGGYITGAKNINIYDADFLEKINMLDKKVPVMVYCKGGVRSADATRQMQKMGFLTIYDLQGGIMSWENHNLPVEKTKGDPQKDLFTLADYDSLLAQHPNLMIDFYAPWCMPCREMEPSFKRLAKQYKGKITIYRINVDEAKMLTRALNIEGIPVIATYKNGTEINRVTGFQTASILRNLAGEVIRKK